MATLISGRRGRDLSGPVPTPLLGWLPWLVRFALSPLDSLERLRRDYGDLIRLGIGRYPAVMIFDPELNRQILRDPSVFYSYDTELVPIPFPRDSSILRVTTGMPLMNGPRHGDHRSALLPYFHKKFITRYHEACIEVTERLVSEWKIGLRVDMRLEMERLAMWLATVPVLGLDPEHEGEAVGRQLERTMSILFNPLAFLLPYGFPGLPYHHLLKHAEEMERIVRAVIVRKRNEGLADDDILSIMIRMHDEDPSRLSERELIGHTTTMFRGGYNPSGMALYWTIFLLGQHPEALRNVRAELATQVRGDAPTAVEVENLPYLEGALKEAMRLFPAGSWTARLATQNFSLDSHAFPKGTWVLLSPYITHRIPEVFPEPYRFLPERWRSIHPSAYEFMPFSAGPRYCIGTSLAMMQLKIALCILLKRFRYDVTPGTRLDCRGLNSIRPKHGLPMVLSRPDSEAPAIGVQGNVHKVVAIPS